MTFGCDHCEYVCDVIAPSKILTISNEIGKANLTINQLTGKLIKVESEDLKYDIENVTAICTTVGAFAVRKYDGTVFAWGDPHYGGSIDHIKDKLENVKILYSNMNAFAALTYSGAVIAWGDPDFGGDISDIKYQLRSVKEIMPNSYAFTALTIDGTVLAWGAPRSGGEIEAIHGELKNVTKVTASHSAFAALKTDHTVVTWGSNRNGGDSSEVQLDLQYIKSIRPGKNDFAFIAKRFDGSEVKWGEHITPTLDTVNRRPKKSMHSTTFLKNFFVGDIETNFDSDRKVLESYIK